jgi:hypothetical protein
MKKIKKMVEQFQWINTCARCKNTDPEICALCHVDSDEAMLRKNRKWNKEGWRILTS